MITDEARCSRPGWFIRVLGRLGTHLDDAALDDLAASLTKLRDAIT